MYARKSEWWFTTRMMWSRCLSQYKINFHFLILYFFFLHSKVLSNYILHTMKLICNFCCYIKLQQVLTKHAHTRTCIYVTHRNTCVCMCICTLWMRSDISRSCHSAPQTDKGSASTGIVTIWSNAHTYIHTYVQYIYIYHIEIPLRLYDYRLIPHIHFGVCACVRFMHMYAHNCCAEVARGGVRRRRLRAPPCTLVRLPMHVVRKYFVAAFSVCRFRQFLLLVLLLYSLGCSGSVARPFVCFCLDHDGNSAASYI